MKTTANTSPEFETFDSAMRTILTVSKTELQVREKEWKQKKDRKKRATVRVKQKARPS